MFSRLHFQECDSTNSKALEWAKHGAPHKSLITCDMQTHGRGRQARTWLHYDGGIACSFILRPQIAIDKVAPITLITATAVMQTLESLSLETLVKWPNDLLLPDDRKFAGILTEATSTDGKLDALVIGIGLNVQRTNASTTEYGFLSDIGYSENQAELLEALLGPLEYHFDQLGNANHLAFCLDYLKHRSATLGKPVTNGIAVDFNPDGSLLVQDSQGNLNSMYTT